VPVNVGTVFLLALGTALATGLGAIPFVGGRGRSRTWLGSANAAASGAMLAASVALLLEGFKRSPWGVAVGAVVGVVAIAGIQRLLRRRPHVHMGSLQGVDAARAFTIVAVMTAHSVAEGVGVGVAFGGGEALGIFITVAIAVHNVPEGLAISLVLVPRGASVASAAMWSVFSSVPQPLIAVPAFLFVETFRAVLAPGLGFAAGAMVWMVASELLPEAWAEGTPRGTVVWGTGAFLAMTALQVALGAL
jgi:zinc transporter, ZIP family